MLYKDILNNIKEKDLYNANYLLKNHIILSKDELENKKQISIFKLLKFKIALLRSKKEPLQYIVGNVNFYGHNYKVNKNVLIPRFETEELVENTINYIKKLFNKNISIIDIGTGTGCIGITLKKELKDVDVTITDISRKVLNVAKYNSNGENINLIKSNLFDNIDNKYDVLISNPPYISFNEKIMDIVKNNEPKKALYANNNGLYFYEEILKNAKKILNKEFLIAFEIGYRQKEDIIRIINKYFENVQIECKKDLNNKDRMIFITNIIKRY